MVWILFGFFKNIKGEVGRRFWEGVYVVMFCGSISSLGLVFLGGCNIFNRYFVCGYLSLELELKFIDNFFFLKILRKWSSRYKLVFLGWGVGIFCGIGSSDKLINWCFFLRVG